MKDILLKRQEVFRKEPVNLSPADRKFFQHDFARVMEDVALLPLSDVWVFENGMVYKSFSVVPESLPSKSWTEKFSSLYLIGKLISRKKTKAPSGKKYLLLSDEWSQHYFHWMLDVLPKLYLMKDRLSLFTLVLPESYTQAHNLAFLEIFELRDIFRLPAGGLVKIKDLTIVEHLGTSGNYFPDVLKGMREYIWKKMNGRLDFSKGERIYISRAKARMRKVANESEIAAVLSEYGFVPLCLEDFSIYEQISICYHARFVVGIHGAGLTNILFMKEGALLELRKENDGHNNCYFSLASALDIRYYYQCNSIIHTDPQTQESDIKVNVEALRENIRLMIETR